MSISSIGGGGLFQSATNVIKRAEAGAAQDAATVASATVADSGGATAAGGADLLGAMVDAKQQVLYSQAGAKLISAANEMMGSLLDISA